MDNLVCAWKAKKVLLFYCYLALIALAGVDAVTQTGDLSGLLTKCSGIRPRFPPPKSVILNFITQSVY